MKRVLITGANSYVGTNVEKWLLKTPEIFSVDTVDTMDGKWKKADFSKYDVWRSESLCSKYLLW